MAVLQHSASHFVLCGAQQVRPEYPNSFVLPFHPADTVHAPMLEQNLQGHFANVSSSQPVPSNSHSLPKNQSRDVQKSKKLAVQPETPEQKEERLNGIERVLLQKESRAVKTLSEIGPDMHPMQVKRILDGKAKLDGSHYGRPSHLTEQEEKQVLGMMQDSVKRGIKLTAIKISEIAQCVWSTSHSNNKEQPPKFGQNWIKNMNRKHPEFRLAAKSVAPSEKRRTKASSRQNVNHALQGLKKNL